MRLTEEEYNNLTAKKNRSSSSIKKSKFHNQLVKTTVELEGRKFEQTFDSKAEYRYFLEHVKPMADNGIIRNVRIHSRWRLLDGITYEDDFSWDDVKTNKTIVVDVKGVLTPEFKLKRKLFEMIYWTPITLVNV